MKLDRQKVYEFSNYNIKVLTQFRVNLFCIFLEFIHHILKVSLEFYYGYIIFFC